MKKVTLIFAVVFTIILSSCSNSGEGTKKVTKNDNTKSEKTGIYEPKTQEEFINILKELGIKPYPNANVIKFSNNADSELDYKITSDGNSNKAIAEYYKKEINKAFENMKGWHKQMETAIGIDYMKGFDLRFGFLITSSNGQREIVVGDTTNIPESLSFSISLGDGAENY